MCVCCARVCVSRRLPFIKLKENEHNVRSHSKISNTFPSVYLIDIQGTGGRFNFPPRVTRSNECVGCRSDLDIRLNLVRKLHPFVSSVTYGEARTCLFIDLTLSLVKLKKNCSLHIVSLLPIGQVKPVYPTWTRNYITNTRGCGTWPGNVSELQAIPDFCFSFLLSFLVPFWS